MICTCVDNGVDPDDPRVRQRTDEATKVILDMILPVGGMVTVLITADGDLVTLPDFMENAIDVEVVEGATVRGSSDNAQAFYDVVNPATYVDPSLAHDNPLIDEGLVPLSKPGGEATIHANFLANVPICLATDFEFGPQHLGSSIISEGNVPSGTTIIAINSPTSAQMSNPASLTAALAEVLVVFPPDLSTLVRRYQYPGLQPGARVKVTGAKRFKPIPPPPDDYHSYLIVQNVEALKLMILSIERYENNSPTPAKEYRDLCLELLSGEVKKHIQDPRNLMRRKARYEDDVHNYARGTHGWTRARIALEVPGAMLLGKSEIGRMLGDAEMRLMERVPMARGCVKEYSANVTSGHILFPGDVDSIIGVAMCGVPLDIRSITFKYLENGPGDTGGCGGSCVSYIEDEGEEYFPTSRTTRRKFRLTGISDSEAARLVFACKIRYIDKRPADQMVIKHYPALLLMTQAIVYERNEKWNEATAGMQQAVAALQYDLDTFLKGIKMTIPVQDFGFGMGSIGGML
jgi:hypothetical protein